MEDTPVPRSVHWPTDEETKAAFEAYTLALGKVAYAWNYLNESLARLFGFVIGVELPISLAIWYSTTNERAQRDMLKAALTATRDERWVKLPKAREDLDWLLEKVNSLSGLRNNAIHAPCSLYIGSGDGVTEMGAAFFQGHPRAKELQGKRVLIEFAWYEDYAEHLTRFSKSIEHAMGAPDSNPWPQRPNLPQRPNMSRG